MRLRLLYVERCLGVGGGLWPMAVVWYESAWGERALRKGAPLITHGNKICTLYNPSIWSRSRNLGLFECYLADVVVNAIVAQAFYFSSIAIKYDGDEIT